jgi:hypothetical protein
VQQVRRTQGGVSGSEDRGPDGVRRLGFKFQVSGFRLE